MLRGVEGRYVEDLIETSDENTIGLKFASQLDHIGFINDKRLTYYLMSFLSNGSTARTF